MAQRWTDLLFAHWPVDPGVVRARVPGSLALDLHDGTAWVSVTAFLLSRLRPRGLPPMPCVSRFPELNVRTYVTRGGKPGVFFFSLDAGRRLAVVGARLLYHLPYFAAAMRIRTASDGTITYVSRRTRGRTPAEFLASYRPAGPVVQAEPGTLDHWLTERYCLYAVGARRRLCRTDIHHAPWPLQPVEADIARNTVSEAAGFSLPAPAPRAAFARRLDVVVWWPTRVTPGV
ncbi:MAG TPA: DUF2071 domain-containing protein [Methylomirabilota bacterium]|jgi:uncharacterized protein YqjF (DUF2071 family)|nr:DUF2071 domain-containing protein [Methylomirabilota bacterium]